MPSFVMHYAIDVEPGDLERFDSFFESREGWESDTGFFEVISKWRFRPTFADRDTLSSEAPDLYELCAELGSEGPRAFCFDLPNVGEDNWGCQRHAPSDPVRVSLDLSDAEVTSEIERVEKLAREITVRETVECWIFGNCSAHS